MSVELSKIDLEYHELPADWAWIKLGEVCNPINGRAFKSSDWKNHGLPIIRIQNLKNRNATFNYFEGKPDEKHLVRAGDLLFAWSGTPGTSFGAHIWNGPPAVLNQHIFKIEFDDKQLDSKYFQYALNQNVTRYVQQAQGGVGLAHITKRKFVDSQIPIAPITDQKRIVAEIDKQFSRLDEAVTSLKRAKANLKRYKAAVLKAAVEGKLTEEWRKQHPDVEPASELLKRILAERRRKWEEAELAKMCAKGKEVKDDNWKKKYKEPKSPDAKRFSNLPHGWNVASLDQLSDPNRSITYGVIKLGSHDENGVPTLRSSNVRYLSLQMDGVKKIRPELSTHYHRTILKGGEVLITVRGTLGGIVTTPVHCKGFNISREVAMVAPLSAINSQCLSIILASKPLQDWFTRQTKGIAYSGINIETLKTVAVPLMPPAEQEEVVKEVKQKLSMIEDAAASIKKEIKRVQQLRQTILNKAFSGKLCARQAPVAG